MIDAVSAAPAGTPAAGAANADAAASAPGDFFSQILAAVMTGLASGAGSAEAAPEEAAAEVLPLPEAGEAPGSELAAEQAAAQLAAALSAVPQALDPVSPDAALQETVPGEEKDLKDGTRRERTGDAATAAFLLGAASFAAPFRASAEAVRAEAVAGQPVVKAANNRAVLDPAAVPEKEAPAAAELMAAAREEVRTGKENGAEELAGELPETKYAAKPSGNAAPVQPSSQTGALKADLAGDKTGQSGEQRTTGGQQDGDVKDESGKAAVQAALKEAAPEKTDTKDALKSSATVSSFIKESVIASREPETAARPAAAGHILSAASVERITSAAGGLESSGNGKISMEINEPGLGKVRVEMALSGGEVNISLQVEKGEAGRFLSGKVPELVDALAQRGISSGVEVFSGNDGGHGGSGREGQNAPRRFTHEAETASAQDAQAAEDGRLSVYA